jgi:hypothetical protein
MRGNEKRPLKGDFPGRSVGSFSGINPADFPYQSRLISPGLALPLVLPVILFQTVFTQRN